MLVMAMVLSASIFSGQDAGRDCARPNGLLETVECYDQRRDQAQSEQQLIFARIDQALARLSPQHGSEPQKARASLSEAQALWTAFVEADCEAGEALFGDGNAFALDALDCKIAHIEARNRSLLAFEERYLGT